MIHSFSKRKLYGNEWIIIWNEATNCRHIWIFSSLTVNTGNTCQLYLPITIITNSLSRILFEKSTVAQPYKKFSALHGTRRSVTMLTRTRHWSVSLARWIQTIPLHPISLRYISIIPSTSRSCYWSFLQMFLPNPCTHYPVCYVLPIASTYISSF
jgi:hypothetical protein